MKKMEITFDEMVLNELDKQFIEEFDILLENDDFYNEYTEIQNMLKKEGF